MPTFCLSLAEQILHLKRDVSLITHYFLPAESWQGTRKTSAAPPDQQNVVRHRRVPDAPQAGGCSLQEWEEIFMSPHCSSQSHFSLDGLKPEVLLYTGWEVLTFIKIPLLLANRASFLKRFWIIKYFKNIMGREAVCLATKQVILSHSRSLPCGYLHFLSSK